MKNISTKINGYYPVMSIPLVVAFVVIVSGTVGYIVWFSRAGEGNSIFVSGVIFLGVIFSAITISIWVLVKKQEKILGELLGKERSINADLLSEKRVLEEELMKRTKELSDVKTSLEIKVRERTGDLEKELAMAKELARAKDEFISITSHELRTPMDAMRGNLDMILKGETGQISKETKEYLQDVLTGADRLVKLVNDILDVSRIESGKLKFDFSNIDLEALASGIVRNFEPSAHERKLNLEFISESKKPLLVFTDKGKVTQVFNNLIGNAMKFTPIGGHIKIFVSGQGDYAYVRVHDSGTGISKENQKKLFQKFVQLHDADGKAPQRGTGLGLYLCREFIHKLGGQIRVESEGENKGSDFIFTLPLSGSQKALEIKRLYEINE